jgi:pimeloyl-ACP methyl ester carboxylesterase
VLQVPQEVAAPQTRLVDLPGRGVTRVWECAGPPDAPALMLIHGVTVTAELNWGQVFAPLSQYFRVIAMDLRGHGDGIPAGLRFRLEDCADDLAALPSRNASSSNRTTAVPTAPVASPATQVVV